MGQGILYVRSNVNVILGNDVIVPPRNDMRRELGDRCSSDRLEDVMEANDVRLDLPCVWLNHRVRERVLDERVRIWFQNVVMRCGNGVADCGVGAFVGVLADEERVCSEPRKGYFEGKVDETSEDTLLGFLFHSYKLAMDYERSVRNVH